MIHTGRMKLMRGEMAINHVAYTSKVQRDAVIETWKQLYAYEIKGMFFQIYPHVHRENDNKFTDKLSKLK